ncbi:MAG TPA: hypothetical protein VK254_00195 [Candidatus Bathyarchaeia archaeon]|nr:hypothetical protein [Candidatus Bathyarchaeia archaeon]
MNKIEKNTMVMIAFFALIVWMAIFYSMVLQKRLQSPLTHFQSEIMQDLRAG